MNVEFYPKVNIHQNRIFWFQADSRVVLRGMNIYRQVDDMRLKRDSATRILGIGNPWWVGYEICRALQIKNVHHALSRLDDDEKRAIVLNDTTGRPQKTILISESGLYELIQSLRKPSAKVFRKWVTKDVLPSIRRKGYYSINGKMIDPTNLSTLDLLAIAKKSEEGRLMEREGRLKEKHMRLTAENQVVLVKGQIKVEQEKVKAVEEHIIELQPKAIAYDEISNYEGLTNFRSTAKLIGIAPLTFIAKLEDERYVFREHGRLAPFQWVINSSLMEYKLVRARDGSGHLYRQSFCTPKGVAYFGKKWGVKTPHGGQRRLFT